MFFGAFLKIAAASQCIFTTNAGAHIPIPTAHVLNERQSAQERAGDLPSLSSFTVDCEVGRL